MKRNHVGTAGVTTASAPKRMKWFEATEQAVQWPRSSHQGTYDGRQDTLDPWCLTAVTDESADSAAGEGPVKDTILTPLLYN